MTDEFTQEEINAALVAENQEMAKSVPVLTAQAQYLSNRATFLRADNTRLKRQVADLMDRLAAPSETEESQDDREG